MINEHRSEQEKQQDTQDQKKQESRLQEEIFAGEWQRLNQFDVYRNRSRQGKILATLQAISQRIAQLEKVFYQLVRDHPQKAAKLLTEIKKLRFLKEYLLQCMIWEERGELEDHDLPIELEETIL
jgi:hypothetical protein